ncbi:MAG: 3-deoxy-D-manno-octulosonic acid transferase [Chitinophagaceae bacterium]
MLDLQEASCNRMFFYTLLIYLYIVLIRAASIWNKKASLWVNGRKGWQKQLKKAISASNGKKVIWVHCASLGEFEQGRPIMERIKKEIPHAYLILTFFSPSGYEIRKDYAVADWVMYLPADTPGNAKKFLDLTNPQVAIFVKYEYWFNILKELKTRNIPCLMVSGIFFEKQFFFRWYGKWAQKFLHQFKMIFVQDLKSEKLLRSIGIHHTILAGDTRFDRVLNIAEQFTHIDEIRGFCNNHFTFVLGSTWDEDEDLWQQWIENHPEQRFIIAPHEVDERHIKGLQKRWKNCIRFSDLSTTKEHSNNHILIIDNIGMLSRLYQYANIAYIGGGFGDGIHNTLEAAVYGKPVIFGPVHEIFTEAAGLVYAGAGFVVHNTKELENCLNGMMHDHKKLEYASNAATNYVKMHAGATQKILNYVQENLLFNN